MAYSICNDYSCWGHMKEPKVNVIIPVYNRERYINRCLSSLLAQTFPDWEAICIDDGSTDNSGHILDLFAEQDRRIKVIHQENAGVSRARNVALQHCSALYVVMVDSDDYLDPSALEIMVSAEEKSSADLVIVGNGAIIPNKKNISTFPSFWADGLHYITPSQFLSVNPCPWGKLYKRDIIDRYDLRFKENITIGEDVVFVVTYWCRSCSCYSISDSLYVVEKADNSLTSAFKKGGLPYSVYADTLKLAGMIYKNNINVIDSLYKKSFLITLFEFFLRERDFVFDYIVCSQEKLSYLRNLSKKHYNFFAKKLDLFTRIRVAFCHNAMWFKGRLFRLLGKIKRFSEIFKVANKNIC